MHWGTMSSSRWFRGNRWKRHLGGSDHAGAFITFCDTAIGKTTIGPAPQAVTITARWKSIRVVFDMQLE